MSLLLRPKNYSAEQAVRITTMASVALCEAIEAVSDGKAESVGKPPFISSPKFEPALALGIDDECRLSVRFPDGTKDRYSSGEISICL